MTPLHAQGGYIRREHQPEYAEPADDAPSGGEDRPGNQIEGESFIGTQMGDNDRGGC